jgi:hypothetical protein
MKKPIKIVLWIIGIVAAVLLVVSLLAGPVAKSYLNHHGEQLTGRHVEVGNIGVNLFSGHLYVRQLAVYEDDGTTQFASFDTLDLRLHLLQLPFRTVNLRHITLSGLRANLLQDGDRFNITSLIEHFAGDKDKPKDTTSAPWTLKFYNIRLSHARLHYNDLRSNKGLTLPDVNLRVPGFVLGGKGATEGGLNLNFDKGGSLNADIDYNASKGDYKATVNLRDFALENIVGYVQDIIEVDEVEGTLSAHVDASGKTTELLTSHIAANASLAGVALVSDRQTLAGFKQFDVKVNNINLDANSFDIATVHLDGLTANYEQWDGFSNISRLLKSNEEEDSTDVAEVPEETEKSDNKRPLRLHVGSLLVENGTLSYTNHTLPEEFQFPITNFNVTANDLTLNGDNNARVRATLPGGGQLAVRWQGNIDHWKQHQDIFLTIKGLDMKLLGPWAIAYTGYPIEDGVFGLTSRTNITQSLLNSQTTLDIYNPAVGKRRKDVKAEKNLPLKTALYVLKDKDDKILLDVPVKGNIDSPEFNYMKLLWKTLGNLIVKVATSPARALGSVLGFGSDNLEFIPIDPTQHGLTSEQYHTLGQLATIAQSDSLIELTLELKMPKAANDTVARFYEMRNETVRHYLLEQGVAENQLTVTTGAPVADKEQTGYAASSQMRIEE